MAFVSFDSDSQKSLDQSILSVSPADDIILIREDYQRAEGQKVRSQPGSLITP